MKANSNPQLPLSPATLQIMLALATRDLHGYGIIQEVSRQSEGRIRVGPGTLYDNLKRLMEQGLVADSPPVAGEEKRLYTLTTGGHAALASEVSRLEDLVAKARPLLQSAKLRRASS